MGATILVVDKGHEDARLLAKKIFELSSELSNNDIVLKNKVEKSLEFGSVTTGVVILTIIGWIAQPIIKKIIDKISQEKGDKNVTVNIFIQQNNTTYQLPQDEQKVLDYYKEKTE